MIGYHVFVVLRNARASSIDVYYLQPFLNLRTTLVDILGGRILYYERCIESSCITGVLVRHYSRLILFLGGGGKAGYSPVESIVVQSLSKVVRGLMYTSWQ